MDRVNSGLVCRAKRSGEISNVGSDVGGLLADGEEEVLAGTAKLLSAKGNALDGNETSYVVVKRRAFSEEGGDVGSGNGLDSIIYQLNGTLIELLHTVAGRDLTADSDGHTNLETKILDGVCGHVVVEIAANAACVSNVNVVSLCARVNGAHSRNDTLNNYYVAVLRVHILFKGIDLELGNNVAVLSGERLALCVSYGELKGVVDGVISELGDNYGILDAVLALFKSDPIIGNRPNYVEGGLLDLHRSNYGVACGCGLDNVLGHIVDILVRCLKVSVHFGYRGVVFVGGLFAQAGDKILDVVELIYNSVLDTFDLIAAYHSGKREKKNEK